MQAGLTLAGEPVQPGRHTLAGDPHRRRDVRLRPPRPIPRHDQQSALEGRTGITVRHENLRPEWVLDSHTPAGGSPYVKIIRPPPTSWPGTTRACPGGHALT